MRTKHNFLAEADAELGDAQLLNAIQHSLSCTRSVPSELYMGISEVVANLLNRARERMGKGRRTARD